MGEQTHATFSKIKIMWFYGLSLSTKMGVLVDFEQKKDWLVNRTRAYDVITGKIVGFGDDWQKWISFLSWLSKNWNIFMVFEF